MEAEPLLSLAVRVVAEHSVQDVLDTIVEGLAAQPEVALARIWLCPQATSAMAASCAKNVLTGGSAFI